MTLKSDPESWESADKLIPAKNWNTKNELGMFGMSSDHKKQFNLSLVVNSKKLGIEPLTLSLHF